MPELETAIAPGEEHTVRETAQQLQVLLQEVYRLLWAKKLIGYKRDGVWFISGASIRARLSARKK